VARQNFLRRFLGKRFVCEESLAGRGWLGGFRGAIFSAAEQDANLDRQYEQMDGLLHTG
jgi:hypothetical protein